MTMLPQWNNDDELSVGEQGRSRRNGPLSFIRRVFSHLLVAVMLLYTIQRRQSLPSALVDQNQSSDGQLQIAYSTTTESSSLNNVIPMEPGSSIGNLNDVRESGEPTYGIPDSGEEIDENSTRTPEQKDIVEGNQYYASKDDGNKEHVKEQDAPASDEGSNEETTATYETPQPRQWSKWSKPLKEGDIDDQDSSVSISDSEMRQSNATSSPEDGTTTPDDSATGVGIETKKADGEEQLEESSAGSPSSMDTKEKEIELVDQDEAETTKIGALNNLADEKKEVAAATSFDEFFESSPFEYASLGQTDEPSSQNENNHADLQVDNDAMESTRDGESSSPHQGSDDMPYEVPFQVFDDSMYHRVCTPVGATSVVCMTIKYPWQVALQDPSYSYPRPVEERLNEIKETYKSPVTIIDGTTLEKCKKESATFFLDEQVKYCLDQTAESSTDPLVVVVFTRQRGDSAFLFGTGTGQHLENILNFFDGQVVQVFGDSTGPGVTSCIQDTFGDCERSPVERKGASYYCGGRATTFEHDRERRLPWQDMDESYNIFLGMDDYYCPYVRADGSHRLPYMNLTQWIAKLGMARNPGWTELRGLTIIISYAFAHMQTEDMILNRWNFTRSMQYQYPEMIMAVQTDEGREALAELGWDLKHVIVFDGLPQFFPTSTSAYFGPQNSLTNATEFVLRGGYPENGNVPAWSPEYGHDCRGPVPTTSAMSKLHRMSRESFESLGLDMRFYIRNWEFSNQFWWMTAGWHGKNGQLDCTHGDGNYYCMHKYLLQATIDDYYDSIGEEATKLEFSSTATDDRMPVVDDEMASSGTQDKSNSSTLEASSSENLLDTGEDAGNQTMHVDLSGGGDSESDRDNNWKPETSPHGSEGEKDVGNVEASNIDVQDVPYEVPFQVFEDPMYHRVCAPVGKSSVVCMTIKYPWQVAFQDPAYSYPRPVEERFKNIKEMYKNAVIIIDGTTLENCKKESATLSLDEQVKYCLDHTAESSEERVVVVFTRQRGSSAFLFGTGSGRHLENILDFFDGQVVQVFGDSTGPGVTNCIQDTFGECLPSPVERRSASFYCGEQTTTPEDDRERRLAWQDMDESYNIFLGMDDYYCPYVRHDGSHRLPDKNLTEWIAKLGMARNPGWTELRGLTIIMSYAFAHMQTEDMILNRRNFTTSMQYIYPELIMSVQTDEGRAALAELGWELKHIIVFDGLPQFFPTSTSAYFGNQHSINNETEFVLRGGYPEDGNIPAWTPEYGHNCRGPVPITSEMSKLHRMSRESFESLGLDMLFYIRNWEFSNQFWWMTAGWHGKNGQLDCTHGHGNYYCMHKYLLQATIDDYYDNLP